MIGGESQPLLRNLLRACDDRWCGGDLRARATACCDRRERGRGRDGCVLDDLVRGALGGRSDTTKAYYDFENAFPLADGWLTACLIGAIVTLRRRSDAALFWLLAAGSAGVYLFCMDALYDIEHGVWFENGGGLIELGINIVTIAFSVWILRWAWTRRLRHGDE